MDSATILNVNIGGLVRRDASVALVLTGLVFAACSHAPPAPPSSGAVAAAPKSSADDRLQPASGFVFVGCGFLVIENHGATHFTVLLRAKNARQLDKKGTAFLLDDVAVETSSTTARAIGVPDLRGRALLLKHMEWEAQYLAGVPGWRGLKPPEIGNIALGMAFPTLTWLVQPTGDVEFAGQKIAAILYVTAAIDDVVLFLASPLWSPRDLEAAGPAMQRILRTLRETPEPTDILAVSASVKGSATRWPGCDGGE